MYFGHYRQCNEEKTQHSSTVFTNQRTSTLNLQLPHLAHFSFIYEISLDILVSCSIIFKQLFCIKFLSCISAVLRHDLLSTYQAIAVNQLSDFFFP